MWAACLYLFFLAASDSFINDQIFFAPRICKIFRVKSFKTLGLGQFPSSNLGTSGVAVACFSYHETLFFCFSPVFVVLTIVYLKSGLRN